jgi:ribosomal-protein-alanine N-acetyltransferase
MKTLNTNVFTQFPILKTPRLTLRELSLKDAEAIFKMRANQRVNQFIARPTMEDSESAADLVQRTRDAYANQQAIGWAGVLRDGVTIIGSCGFNRFEAENLRAEIGGEMAPKYWGKGIAQEAVAAILQFGLETIGLHAIEAKVDPGNRGACALLDRFGFVKEAVFRDRIYFQGEFRDMAVYTLIKGNEKKLAGF